MTPSLILSAGCMSCGGEMEDVNASHTPPYRWVGVYRCVKCGHEFALEVRMAPVGSHGPLGWGKHGTGERPRDYGRRAVGV